MIRPPPSSTLFPSPPFFRSEAASRAAADPAVREAMVAEQRRLLATGDWVAEGRDIGTVVAPDAAVKVFLTASPEERSEEHTSELQSQSNLVCRLLLEKKKKK